MKPLAIAQSPLAFVCWDGAVRAALGRPYVLAVTSLTIDINLAIRHV